MGVIDVDLGDDEIARLELAECDPDLAVGEGDRTRAGRWGGPVVRTAEHARLTAPDHVRLSSWLAGVVLGSAPAADRTSAAVGVPCCTTHPDLKRSQIALPRRPQLVVGDGDVANRCARGHTHSEPIGVARRARAPAMNVAIDGQAGGMVGIECGA